MLIGQADQPRVRVRENRWIEPKKSPDKIFCHGTSGKNELAKKRASPRFKIICVVSALPVHNRTRTRRPRARSSGAMRSISALDARAAFISRGDRARPRSRALFCVFTSHLAISRPRPANSRQKYRSRGTAPRGVSRGSAAASARRLP
eukprot:12314-Pelagococcus_subviridis.AAC.5